MLMPYTYTSLAKFRDEIRLLTLHEGGFHDELVADLTTHTLHARPQYEAVSYRWAGGGPSISVKLNNTTLLVDEHAAVALRSCRQENRSISLWIDQICINQQDAEERAWQVQLMGRIYKSATSVNVCLNQGHPGLDVLFRFTNELARVFLDSRSCLCRKKTVVDPNSPLSMMMRPEWKLPPKYWKRLYQFDDNLPAIHEAFDIFICDSWFQRAWVVQEVALAKRVNIICGANKAEWETIMCLATRMIPRYTQALVSATVAHGMRGAMAIDVMRTRQPKNNRSIKMAWNLFRSDIRSDTYQKILENVTISLYQLRYQQYPPFLSILRHLRYLQSTDERDKIFGFIGLAAPERTNSVPFNPTDDVAVSYITDISTVCFGLAFSHIVDTGTLDILMATCQAAKAHDNLPYWTPDWSQEASLCDTEYACPLRLFQHKASHEPAKPEIVPKEKALILKGMEFDIVDAITENVISFDDYQTPAHPVWAEWKTLAMKQYPNDPYSDQEGHFNAFWRTLIYDTDDRGRRASSKLGKDFKRWLNPNDKSLPPTKSTYNPAKITGRFVFKSRKLYRTRKGYLGNACSNVQPGDRVFVLNGGRLPFVLRADRIVEGVTSETSTNGLVSREVRVQGYKMVGGDSYVHGLCDGEAWRLCGRNERVLKEIALV